MNGKGKGKISSCSARNSIAKTGKLGLRFFRAAVLPTYLSSISKACYKGTGKESRAPERGRGYSNLKRKYHRPYFYGKEPFACVNLCRTIYTGHVSSIDSSSMHDSDQ